MIKTYFLTLSLLMVFGNFCHGSINKKGSNNKDLYKISSYYSDLKKTKHRPRLARKVSKLFDLMGDEFNNEKELLRLQLSINKKPFRVSKCSKSFNKYQTKVSKYHLLRILNFCHKKLTVIKKEDQLNEAQLYFVKKFYGSLIENNLLGIIKLGKKSSVFPNVLAEVLSLKNYDIDELTSLFQRTSIGLHLNYGHKLTHHLQSIGLFPGKESSLFKKEFRIQISKFLNDKGFDSSKLEHILSFYSENRILIGHRYSNRKFRQIARHLIKKGLLKEARRFTSRALETQTKNHRSDLYFERLYVDLIQDDYKAAIKYINRSGLLGLEDSYDSRLRFWIARIFMKNSETSLAEFLFKAQITKNPLNYYSVLSAAHLNKLGERKFLEETYLYNGQNKLSIFKSELKEDKNTLKRLSVWLKSDNNNLANLEIQDILASHHKDSSQFRKLASSESSETSFQILKLFQEESDYLKSFKFFSRNKLFNNFNFLPTATKLLFPTPYLKEVKKISNGLDPILLLSLIRQESAFDPRAKSSAGARGLMQLMPNTARMFKRNLRKSDLYKPRLNLRLGSKYLKGLYTKYNKSLIHTLSAYNAGETNLKRWMKNYFKMKDDLLKVESIPFHETEGYVKYITRNIFFYKIIFGEPLLSGNEWVNKSI